MKFTKCVILFTVIFCAFAMGYATGRSHTKTPPPPRVIELHIRAIK
jgi:hypothetical protein